MIKNETALYRAISMAGGNGFEPILDAPEASVLPLDEPPISRAGSILSCPTKTGKLKLALSGIPPGSPASIILNIEQDQHDFCGDIQEHKKNTALNDTREHCDQKVPI